MTMLLHIKNFACNLIKMIMYNNHMKKQQPRKRSSAIFLILGMAFLTIGLATDRFCGDLACRWREMVKT
jgi:hypothetical protein